MLSAVLAAVVGADGLRVRPALGDNGAIGAAQALVKPALAAAQPLGTALAAKPLPGEAKGTAARDKPALGAAGAVAPAATS